MGLATKRLVLCAFGILLASVPAVAQAPETYLELLRSDVRAARVEVLTEALDMTRAESEKFWPIFREYDTELMALSDRRVSLIKTFVDTFGTATNEQIADIAKESFSIQQDRLKLRKKYFKKVEKEVGIRTAARFVQVENVIGMLIDLQVAAELPLME